MLLRSMSGAIGCNEQMLFESVALAKESAKLDPSNERAWSGLGAAHFSLHINVTSAAEDLHMAHRAFTQAAKVSSDEKNPDLHLNHANVLMLLDATEAALKHCTRAHELDPSLGADQARAAAWSSAMRVSEAIAAKRAAMPNRKFSQMLADLPPTAAGSSMVPLSSLSLGENAEQSVVVKVVVAVPQSGMRLAAQHLCLIVADVSEELMALTIYEMRGVPTLDHGTTLELRAPSLHRIEVTRSWQAPADGNAPASCAFHLLRVESPSAQLRINGHAVRARAAAPRGAR
jgi:tetratricopeptide (TPR) repeat protein